ncbi:MAG: hypothetical protein Fur005_38300 [Roseiflexaceae bacterium]
MDGWGVEEQRHFCGIEASDPLRAEPIEFGGWLLGEVLRQGLADGWSKAKTMP